MITDIMIPLSVEIGIYPQVVYEILLSSDEIVAGA